MAYEAKVLADSVSDAGHRVTTLQVTFPRLILAEFNTHRVLSRNSASSRAIPVERRIQQILDSPFIPEAFGKNKRGMQADEALTDADNALARNAWSMAALDAVRRAQDMAGIGVHKQHANRVIETYAWHTVIVTSTEWSNWDALRVSRMAQPEMFKIAGMMREVRQASTPVPVGDGDWHLPLVRGEIPLREEIQLRVSGFDPVKVCVGRCAAISYERQADTSPEKANAVFGKLSADGHMSPFEHALRPMGKDELEMFRHPEYVWNTEKERFEKTGRDRFFLGNVEGWVQCRKMIPGEDVYRGA